MTTQTKTELTDSIKDPSQKNESNKSDILTFLTNFNESQMAPEEI